jgi:hypothetical protein
MDENTPIANLHTFKHDVNVFTVAQQSKRKIAYDT